MAKRKLRNKLIPLSEIKEKIKKIYNDYDYYISENGNVYIEYEPNLFLKKALYKTQGYMYCKLLINGKLQAKRVHRLVAKAFIENNDKNKIVVGHKNNIKDDNRVSNLYWTTVQENTQKAYDDGLAKNKKGFDDSQSYPICMLDLQGNLIKNYGSISECSYETNICKSTIARQCKHLTKGNPRCGYRFRYKEEFDNCGFIL